MVAVSVGEKPAHSNWTRLQPRWEVQTCLRSIVVIAFYESVSFGVALVHCALISSQS